MSSILDALEKVEATERWTPPAVPARPEGRSKLRLAAIAAGAAFAAGAGVAALVLRHAAAPEPARVSSAAPAVEPARVAPLPAAPVPPAPAPANAPPTAVAAEPPAPAPAAAIPPKPDAAALAAPAEAPAPMPAVAAPPRPVAAAAPTSAATRAAPAEASRQAAVAAVEPRREPSDESRPAPRLPTVRLSFLVYSPSAERRSVVLATEGGNLTTLREGEQVGNIEVARILPDRVELRYEGRVFTVRPRD